MKRYGTKMVILSFLALTGFGFAKSTYRNECKADVEKFCGAHKKDRKSLTKCFQKNKGNFAPICKEQIKSLEANKAERKARTAKLLETCLKDLDQFCPKRNGKVAAPLYCLSHNREKLSEKCKAAVPQERARKNGSALPR